MNLIRDLLYADDYVLAAYTEANMQRLMGAFEKVCAALELTI